MVQILPPATNLGAQLGQSLGQGLQTGLTQSLQQQYQRGQLQKALQGVQDIASKPNASAFDLASSLISATAGIPGAERYVGQLFPLLLQQMQAKRLEGLESPSIGGMPAPSQSQNIQQEAKPQAQSDESPTATTDPFKYLNAAQQNIPNLPVPASTPDIFNGTLEPTALGLGPIPPQYDEQQIIQARNEDLRSGLPNSPRAEAMEKYNDLSRKKTSDITQAAITKSQIAQAAAARQNEFRETLQAQLGITDPSDLAVAENIAERPEFRKIANDKIRADRAAKEFKIYQADKDEFTRSSNRPNPVIFSDKYKQSLDTLGTKAQNLIKYGQRDKAYEILSKNGWSESEIAKIMNPLDSKLKSEINSLPEISRYVPVGNVSGKVPEQTIKQNEQAFDKWSKFLEKNIKPGSFDPKNPDVFQPGVSLVLLRNAALKNKISGLDFDRMLNNLISSKKITLDPYQDRELKFMNQNPTRVWSLYETIFGAD